MIESVADGEAASSVRLGSVIVRIDRIDQRLPRIEQLTADRPRLLRETDQAVEVSSERVSQFGSIPDASEQCEVSVGDGAGSVGLAQLREVGEQQLGLVDLLAGAGLADPQGVGEPDGLAAVDRVLGAAAALGLGQQFEIVGLEALGGQLRLEHCLREVGRGNRLRVHRGHPARVAELICFCPAEDHSSNLANTCCGDQQQLMLFGSFVMS